MDEKLAVRRRILDAAAESFSREGFAGARVERIAKAAGVNKAGLYYHVGNKARLFEEVMVELFSQMADRLEAAMAAAESPAQSLDILVRALAQAFEDGPAQARIMLIEVARGGLNVSEKVMHQVERVFLCTAQAVRRGVEGGQRLPENPFFVHMCMVGSLSLFALSGPIRARVANMGLGRRNGIDPTAPLGEMAEFLVGLFQRGLAVPPPKAQEEKRSCDA
ncbi:TetR/AcrR family transcriptional regulator [Desulfolutivibrio sp.]|uniref:TetR/AcrR family transcriptional regulator n=1 Tax=Desulfolutivibrio sp. TaxID=2773296 RepID=UPI002F96E2A0